MKQYTDITVLLDRSGSMDTIKNAMESAYNEFLSKHKEVPSTRITLIQFDDANNHDVVYQNVPIAAAEPLSLNPRGGTPLIDAFVKAIDRTGERLANLRESERPDQVLMVVITDGQENASKIHRRSDVALRVRKQSETYNWKFLYLGANQDAISEAASYGIGLGSTITYNASQHGTASSMGALAANSMCYTSNATGSRGTLKSFTKEQRKLAVDDTDTSKTPSSGDSNGTV